jgi:hypothetical protein
MTSRQREIFVNNVILDISAADMYYWYSKTSLIRTPLSRTSLNLDKWNLYFCYSLESTVVAVADPGTSTSLAPCPDDCSVSQTSGNRGPFHRRSAHTRTFVKFHTPKSACK